MVLLLWFIITIFFNIYLVVYYSPHYSTHYYYTHTHHTHTHESSSRVKKRSRNSFVYAIRILPSTQNKSTRVYHHILKYIIYIIKIIHSYLNIANRPQGLRNAYPYARLPEWSKGLDLRSSIFVCVGSNPTAGKSLFFYFYN